MRSFGWQTACAVMIAAIVVASPVAAEEAAGDWVGEMASGFKLRLKVERTGDGYVAAMTNPNGETTRLDDVRSDGAGLHFAVTQLGLAYAGVWDEAATAWRGDLTYQGVHPMTFRRATAAELAPKIRRRPQEDAIASGPLPYATHDVTFANTEAAITLAGTLRTPQGSGPFPAVVLISGTGPNSRDEEVEGHKVFLVLADALVRRGLAVLSYDKRGVGASGGRMRDATTTDFASDARAAVTFLKGRPGIDPRRTGLLGHSEGGIIAPMVAAGDGDIAFVVLMASPGVRGDRLLVQQAAAVARVQGAPPAYVARRQAFDEAVYAAILAAPSAQAARAAVDALAADGLRQGMLDAAEARTLAADTTTVWGRHFIALDPAASLRKVTAPVLAVGGALDVQVPAAENLAVIRAALAANPDVTVVEVPRLNHLLQTATTGAPAEYGEIDEAMAPEALRLIGDWVAARAKLAR